MVLRCANVFALRCARLHAASLRDTGVEPGLTKTYRRGNFQQSFGCNHGSPPITITLTSGGCAPLTAKRKVVPAFF